MLTRLYLSSTPHKANATAESNAMYTRRKTFPGKWVSTKEKAAQPLRNLRGQLLNQ